VTSTKKIADKKEKEKKRRKKERKKEILVSFRKQATIISSK